MDDQHLPVVDVRLAEARSGSTLLMQPLANADAIVFDDRHDECVETLIAGFRREVKAVDATPRESRPPADRVSR